MRALVVYESMYGNTHTVASHVAEGLRAGFEVDVVPVGGATAELVGACDLLVCGGPTHAHGLATTMSRESAIAAAEKEGSDLTVDPDAAGEGLRDWFTHLPTSKGASAAAFDTRIDAPAALTGRASKGIARRLRSHGFRVVVDPESFLVDKQSHLVDGEAERATAWGATLAEAAALAAHH